MEEQRAKAKSNLLPLASCFSPLTSHLLIKVNMKKHILLSLLVAASPTMMMAQDDMYFTPSKQSKVQSSVEDLQKDEPTYYSGSSRDVDEYNRRGTLKSYYQKIGEDSLGNDIIVFHEGDGRYDTSKADTVYRGSGSYYGDDDYTYSRRMHRFDGFYDPWFYGYHSYYPWYDSWYDPWYYGGWGWSWRARYGWYDPWYYGYYGWGYPYHYYGWYYPRYYGGYAHAGTRNHRFPRQTVGGSRGVNRSGNRTFGQRNQNYGTRSSRSWNNSGWNNGSMHSPSRSSGSFGGGSFGGGSRGGGFGGGSRGGGGGGGHFGRR